MSVGIRQSTSKWRTDFRPNRTTSTSWLACVQPEQHEFLPQQIKRGQALRFLGLVQACDCLSYSEADRVKLQAFRYKNSAYLGCSRVLRHCFCYQASATEPSCVTRPCVVFSQAPIVSSHPVLNPSCRKRDVGSSAWVTNKYITLSVEPFQASMRKDRPVLRNRFGKATKKVTAIHTQSLKPATCGTSHTTSAEHRRHEDDDLKTAIFCEISMNLPFTTHVAMVMRYRKHHSLTSITVRCAALKTSDG